MVFSCGIHTIFLLLLKPSSRSEVMIGFVSQTPDKKVLLNCLKSVVDFFFFLNPGGFCVTSHSVGMNTLLLIISCNSEGSLETDQAENRHQTAGEALRAYLPVCSATSKAHTIMARSIFQCTERTNLQKEDKEKNGFSFLHLRKCAC